ncbi:MAG: ABC transporter substrate-binding protein [Chloroflexota bacterium]
MVTVVSRRALLKGAAGTAAALSLVKRSSVFAAPAVLQETGSKVKVTYWGSFTDALGEAERGLVQRFNESQDEVELEYQYQGTYEETAQKLTAALAAKQTPDVSLLSDVWWFKFYLNRAIAPLNDFISANNIDTSDYVDSLWIEGIRDGVQYWIPMARSTPLFYYNKEMFREVGLDHAPTTWAEFEQVAPELVRKDGDTLTRAAFAHPSAGSYIAWLFQCVVWQYGGRYSDENFTIMMTSPETVAAGEFYRRSVMDGWASTPQDLNTDFLNGLTASMMASTGGLAGITRDAKFEFGTAFLPEGPAGFGCCTGGSGLAILADKPKEKQEAAFKFVMYASSPEGTAWWSQNTGYMPVRKSAAQSEEMQAFFATHPNFKTAVDQLPKTRPQDAARVFIPNGDQIIGKGLEEITITKSEVLPAFERVQKTLEEEAKPVLEALKARQG